jgi:hypothetical protein
MPNTTNFNWPTPADTDLVKDGAAAIRNLGDGVDTSLVDLKGGTTGQILSKASDTDMDFAFITPNVGDLTEVQAGTGISVADGTGPIPIVTNTVATEFDAKGDLVVGTGSDTFDRLAVGTDGFILQADSSVSPQGLKWAVDPVADVVTTAGDLLYATAADTVTRLGIGTVGQVLQVNSGATAPEWAAPAGGASGLTLITQNTFSNVASVTIDSVFSTTYRNYIAYINYYSATNADDFQLQWRYSSTTLTSSVYYGAGFHYNGSNTLTTYGYLAAGQATLAANTGSSTRRSSLQINFNEVGTGSSVNPHFFGTGFSNQGEQTNQFAGMPDATQDFTGFLLKSSSANITGEYQIYGLAI